jgi:AcrR family transcriptional regulator
VEEFIHFASSVTGVPADLRSDAQRNRERIVSAASQVFAERGLDASLEEVADRAGVGVATLYRRFPCRDDLIAASFEGRVREYADAVEEAQANPDPWEGFCHYVERVCAAQVGDRGLGDVLVRTFPHAPGLECHRARARAAMVELIERAKAAGKLRADFSTEDIPLLLMANAGVVQSAPSIAPVNSQRLVGYLLQAFRADTAAVAGEVAEPVSPRRMQLALARISGQRPSRRGRPPRSAPAASSVTSIPPDSSDHQPAPSPPEEPS